MAAVFSIVMTPPTLDLVLSYTPFFLL
jgi:hypothetical protein